ncbi:MAG TPA: phenylalanine--tRNA ligase subunit beta [Candidatus Paceibacterota bacterium]|jgi:phenylalanyl-tRNA synthetase beta chain|nr:phenylalanine--tRNA ligase subunit beta [Candidatus Paceibacterota bacterium]
MKISYNWLKWYIPEAPEAEKLADILTYHLAEVETVEKLADDFIFDIKILPNRAHDLLSHQGIAREIASLLNIAYVDPIPKYKVPKSAPTNLKINILTDKDRRHMGRIVRNVTVGPSPEWVVKHLASIGQRSINNIVDATNITMFDCGQPTHAFDLNKVEGLELNIRNAKAGEKITLLTGEEKELKDGMLAICDGAGNILDTGIKGGKHAEITSTTTDLILEADNFEPVFARKTGQALNIFTDARKRFENNLSPELAPYAMLELSALIAEMCPEATFEEIVDIYPQKQVERKLSFSAEKISKILGLDISVVEVGNILERYNIEYKNDGDIFEIIVPSMRLDLEIEEDMAEEIGRILGYDRVKGVIPKINFKPKVNETYQKITFARNKLLASEYSEVMTYTFCNKGELEVMQSASDKKFLRTNLSDGLKESFKLNKINSPILGIDEVKIFEIGTVWCPQEEMHVAYADKKEVKEMTLDEFCKSAEPDTFTQSLGHELRSTTPSEKHAGSAFQMWSLFPFIARDIAVWVSKGTESDEIAKIIKENMGDLAVKGPDLFDSFTKEDKTSYAFKLVFQSYDRTLTDAEINEMMNKITDKIKENSDWQVR